MANRIQIRRGSSAPSTSNLLNYELGWSTNEKVLYINNNNSNIVPVADGFLKIAGTALASGDDINNISEYGLFYSAEAARSQQLNGTPPYTDSGFRLYNFRNYHLNYNYQIATGTNSIKVRFKSNSTTWRDWRTILDSDGGTMNGNLTITRDNHSANTGLIVQNTDTTNPLKLGYMIGSSGSGGIYDYTHSAYKVEIGPNGTATFYGNATTATTATAATYVRITDTTPTSGTSYYLTFTAGTAANTNYALRGNALVRVYIATDGTSCYLNLGDSSHVGGISLFSSSGKYLNLVTSAMADSNKTITFPNATGTVALTSNLDSYVLKAGDTMTGTVKLAQSSGIYNEGSPMFYWLAGSASSYQKMGTIFIDPSTVNSKKVCNRFYFREYSYDSSTGVTLEKWDQYRLPAIAADKTDSSSYEILTSKSAVTIAQGGTGATTAANAIKALLNGVATGTGVITNDTYFIRKKDSNYSTVSAYDIATYMINQVNIQDNVLNKTADYTLTAADSGKFIVYHTTADRTVTIPNDSTIPIGAEYTILRHGLQSSGGTSMDGKVYIQKAINMYVTTNSGGSSSNGHYSSTTKWSLSTRCAVFIKKIATDTWYIDGDHLSTS